MFINIQNNRLLLFYNACTINQQERRPHSSEKLYTKLYVILFSFIPDKMTGKKFMTYAVII